MTGGPGSLNSEASLRAGGSVEPELAGRSMGQAAQGMRPRGCEAQR